MHYTENAYIERIILGAEGLKVELLSDIYDRYRFDRHDRQIDK